MNDEIIVTLDEQSEIIATIAENEPLLVEIEKAELIGELAEPFPDLLAHYNLAKI